MSIFQDFDCSSDGASSSDGALSDDDDTHDSQINLDSIKSTKLKLWIHGEYTNWTPQEAFRELIQNWRDGIIAVNEDLTERDFCVHRDETSWGRRTEIVYKAYRDGADRSVVENCLGFICFKSHNGAGTIELSNFNATLQPQHLTLGGTSKKDQQDQAGAHGEGLKVAALVLMRSTQNHHLRCTSGGCNWTFALQQGCLVVSINRINMASKKAKGPQSSTSKIPTPDVSAYRDVQFIIGEGRMGRDEKGNKVKRVPVQQTDFEHWTKAALFTTKVDSEDTGIISTEHGDLLTADDMRGNIYLKGLLLCESTKSRSASITGRRLLFGYNFADGRTNRERQSVATASDESKGMCRIISNAMKERPEMIGDLVEALDSETDYADVACPEKFWSKEIGILIRGYLLREGPADSWLYCSDDMSKDTRLRQAIAGIGGRPCQVSNKCWKILKMKGLVRNGIEEALWRFGSAEEVPQVPDTSFATSVIRLLRACIKACPQTTNMDIKFMRAGQLHLDLAISNHTPLLRIHERWLSIEDAKTELGLFGNVAEDKVVAITVKHLFAKTLHQLPQDVFQQEGSPRSPDWHENQEKSRAELRLANSQQMQVRIVDGTEPGLPGLCVEWAVNAQEQDDNSWIEVQCHLASKCSHFREKLLIASDVNTEIMSCITQEAGSGLQDEDGEIQSPTCRAARTEFQQGSHRESGLEEGEEYFFVLVTPTDRSSFVSMSSAKRVVAPAPVTPSKRGSRSTHQSFSLGPQPAAGSLDPRALDFDRAFIAENSKDLKAYIIVAKDEPRHPDESRKRRRVEWDA